MAKILITQGANSGESHNLKDESTIGRSLKNTITIMDGRASRQHIKIFKEDDVFFV